MALTVAVITELGAQYSHRPNAVETLKHAALSGNIVLVQECRAQVKAVPNDVLRYAVLSGNVEVVRLALSWGLDVHQRDSPNRDLSFYVTQSDSLNVMSLIREQLATTQPSIRVSAANRAGFCGARAGVERVPQVQSERGESTPLIASRWR